MAEAMTETEALKLAIEQATSPEQRQALQELATLLPRYAEDLARLKSELDACRSGNASEVKT